MLRGGEVYTPDPCGQTDLWITGERIAAMSPGLGSVSPDLPHEEIDLDGLLVFPGFIDAHVHLTGGGGEGGPETRVPPVQLTSMTTSGVTTCVGVLGTDGTTRTVRDLVATTLGMRRLGINAYCYTGSYRYPVPTLTGSVRDDIVFIDPVIGVGELALSDHRSSQLTLEEFARVASDAYTAGLMSGKAGVLHIHMGDGPRRFELLEEALKTLEIPARVYHPTHVNRNLPLFEAAMRLSAKGVTVDVTAFPEADGGLLASDAIARWLDEGCDPTRLTCSSDGGGCLPTFDPDGELVAMDIGASKVLADTVSDLMGRGLPIETWLPIFTRNIARVLRLSNVGSLAPGKQADLVILDRSGQIRYVMCRGVWLVRDGVTMQHGPFEEHTKVNQ
jgi:beta-aspartyl-dipeptidase (metallo-type)